MSDNIVARCWHSTPPVTRILCILSLTTSLLTYTNLCSPFFLCYSKKLVLEKHQYHRLVTSFLYFGNLTIDNLLHIIFLCRYSHMLEDLFINTTDYLMLLLVNIAFIFFFGSFLNMSLFSNALSAAITYVWTRKNPHTFVSLLGCIVFPAFYLPFVVPFFSFVTSWKLPWDDLLGVFVGHLYYFLKFVVPSFLGYDLFKVPRVFKKVFGEAVDDETKGFVDLLVDRIHVLKGRKSGVNEVVHESSQRKSEPVGGIGPINGHETRSVPDARVGVESDSDEKDFTKKRTEGFYEPLYPTDTPSVRIDQKSDLQRSPVGEGHSKTVEISTNDQKRMGEKIGRIIDRRGLQNIMSDLQDDSSKLNNPPHHATSMSEVIHPNASPDHKLRDNATFGRSGIGLRPSVSDPSRADETSKEPITASKKLEYHTQRFDGMDLHPDLNSSLPLSHQTFSRDNGRTATKNPIDGSSICSKNLEPVIETTKKVFDQINLESNGNSSKEFEPITEMTKKGSDEIQLQDPRDSDPQSNDTSEKFIQKARRYAVDLGRDSDVGNIIHERPTNPNSPMKTAHIQGNEVSASHVDMKVSDRPFLAQDRNVKDQNTDSPKNGIFELSNKKDPEDFNDASCYFVEPSLDDSDAQEIQNKEDSVSFDSSFGEEEWDSFQNDDLQQSDDESDQRGCQPEHSAGKKSGNSKSQQPDDESNQRGCQTEHSDGKNPDILKYQQPDGENRSRACQPEHSDGRNPYISKSQQSDDENIRPAESQEYVKRGTEFVESEHSENEHSAPYKESQKRNICDLPRDTAQSTSQAGVLAKESRHLVTSGLLQGPEQSLEQKQFIGSKSDCKMDINSQETDCVSSDLQKNGFNQPKEESESSDIEVIIKSTQGGDPDSQITETFCTDPLDEESTSSNIEVLKKYNETNDFGNSSDTSSIEVLQSDCASSDSSHKGLSAERLNTLTKKDKSDGSFTKTLSEVVPSDFNAFSTEVGVKDIDESSDICIIPDDIDLDSSSSDIQR